MEIKNGLEKVLRVIKINIHTMRILLSIVMAFIMLLADRSHSKSINITNHKYIDSLYIGCAQALAVIPGVSRSGSTISIALLSGAFVIRLTTIPTAAHTKRLYKAPM